MDHDWESVESESASPRQPEVEPATAEQLDNQVDQVGEVAAEPCSGKELQLPAGKQIRVQLPSGNTLDICERVAAISEAAPPTDTDALDTDTAQTLWRVINTNRRWSSAVQMLQNKLREEKRPANVLRDAFLVAAQDTVLPGRISQHDLAAKLAELAVAMAGLPEWAWLEPVVKQLQRPDKPSTRAQHATTADGAHLQQAKLALLFAVCCVYSPSSGVDTEVRDDCTAPVLEAIPASFQVAITGYTTVAFGSGLLVELMNEQSTGVLSSVGLNMDFTAVNRTRAELQERAKQSAREQQLYGRTKSRPIPPAPHIVPCTVTLRGPDFTALQRLADKAAQVLGAEAAKRRRADTGTGNSKRRAGAAKTDVAAEDGPTVSCLAAALADNLLTSR